MKKYIYSIIGIFISVSIFGQEQKIGVKLNLGATSGTYNATYNGSQSGKITVHVGAPFMGVKEPVNNIPFTYVKVKSTDVAFPWGELLVNKTFSRDEFTVSKGYFTDRIELNWRILNNISNITSFQVFRTEDLETASPIWGNAISTLSANATSYIDNNAEGGKLYRYKVKVIGTNSLAGAESELTNFITGIGYRNPTGIVTGSITFKGGNPVENVLVSAIAEGASGVLGKSVFVPANGYIKIPSIKNALKDSLTIQAWVKNDPYNAGLGQTVKIYELFSNSGEQLTATSQIVSNTLTITIGNSVFVMQGKLPTGRINNKGDDIYADISTFDSTYFHVTTVLKDGKKPLLYINGRPMTAAYYVTVALVTGVNTNTLNTSSVTEFSMNTNDQGNARNWNAINFGGVSNAYFDDIRIFNKSLSDAEIKLNYRRYLRGDESGLTVYLRMDEGAGKSAYDLSFKGSTFNGNDAIFYQSMSTNWIWYNGSIPSREQLGIFGITNSSGSYTIAAIPYKGSGELFKITPSLGVHKFNPSQESVFIGPSSSVINRLNFVDESSFVFRGRALYDSRGVFPATTDAPITGDIHDNEVYNAYTVGDLNYPKGEYWGEFGTGDDSNRIVRLRRYAPIALEGAFVYVDNQIVLDANNMPVLTDANGRFRIQVPIGKHSVSVKKTFHGLKYDGRYPAMDSVTANGITTAVATYKDFYEDNDAEVTYIDTTKVTIVGRVVGGQKELNKPIGFGFRGAYSVNKPVKRGSAPEQMVVSSVNNIGTAEVTFGFRQPNVTGALPAAFKTNFRTDSATGEYRINILPLRYELNRTDVYIASQRLSSMQRFLTEDQILNYTDIPVLQRSSATFTDSLNKTDTLAKSLPYHYVKNFAYLATPQISLIEQLADTSFKVGDSTYKVASTFTRPIYTQLQDYTIKFQRQERYFNYEKLDSLSIVPATQGTLSITNNFAYPASEKVTTDELDESKLIYSFKVGTANTNVGQGFSNTLSANYLLNGNATAIPGVRTTAVVLGGAPDGSQSFTTQGPDKIDFILRDPPGSGSSATIEKGTALSITSENQFVYNSTAKVDLIITSGVKFITGVGVAIPSDATNEVGARININYGTSYGKALNTKYTFGQSISTSSSSDITGSAADVYIGNSTNYFYGMYDNIAVTENERFDANNNSLSIPLATTSGTKYITKNKAIFYSPDGQATTFAYSQNYILTELIPTYQTILNGLRNGSLQSGGQSNLKDSSWYKGSIDAWRSAIFRNEARKYLVYKELTRDSLKKAIRSDIQEQYSTGAMGASSLTAVGSHVLNTFDKTFYKNLSIDSKVGSYGESLEIANTTSYVTNFTLGLGIGVLLEQNATVSGTGFKMKVENENVSTYNYNQQQDIESTTNVSYTLSDSDPYNVLSVDVINSFDGNGPIFIRKGGISSCPAEPADSTNFFIPSLLSRYNNQNFSIDSLVYNPAGANKVEISAGTIFVQKPVITVRNNTAYGVPATGKAQFILTLQNASVLEPASSDFKLTVNPQSNPDGARFNISSQGVPVTLNGSKAIQYTVFMEKGAADVFDYENIQIDFSSVCDGNVSASVLISAHFVPSCTKVDLVSPTDNWSVNYTTSNSNGSTIPVPVVLNGFTTSYTGFKRMALQYRSQGSPSWTTLKTYVATIAEKNALVAQGYEADLVEVIGGTELNYAWDVARLRMADGNYEMRATSYCSNGTTFESIPITGKVDLNPPVLFGTPTPSDGILSIGQDIKVRFNEPVKKMGSLTRTEFVVQKNQLIVDHNVALSFTGATSKASILQPYLKSGNLSIEFWLRKSNTSNAVIMSQEGGFSISASSTTMTFAVGTQSIIGDISNDGSYHHYTCTYDGINGKFSIIQDDIIVKSEVKSSNLLLDNNNTIVLGGTAFQGKIHELRLWNLVISRETAVANMYASLLGNEDGLLGNWPMSEGNGLLAKDIARFKHISLENVNWDIFPNTQSYAFNGTNYLTLSNASRSIFSSTMDGTIEFWFKTTSTSPSTIISNGKGDASDDSTSSGYRNKWSFDLSATGELTLKAENKSYSFGAKNLADGLWHHAAVVLKRKGNLSTYIDGLQTQNYPTQGIGGFSNAVLYIGARGQVTNASPLSIDRKFTGQIDDIRIWNMARPADQIAEDMYYEQDYLRTGLVLYAPLNSPEQLNNNGPRYYYPINATEKVSANAVLSTGSSLSYSSVTPPIKPIRNREFLVVNSVVNNDEMILNPSITDWASIEKKIAYITVANMFDLTDNMQESPISWTAYVNKNPLKWYIEGYNNKLNIAVDEHKSQTYQLVIANVGGIFQNFTLSLPSWIKVQSKSGTISPNSQVRINLSVDTTISAGSYFDEIKLISNYNFNEKIQVNLRVLKPEPNWNFNPLEFEENMNVISKVKVDGVFSKDTYDKVIAYSMDSVRGIAPIYYDSNLDEYFALLTIYGNTDAAGTPINFKIWDASDGRLKAANFNNTATITFQPNANFGVFSQPVLFTNSGLETQILSMNKGWTWVSFNLNDSAFRNLNTFFKNSKLTQGDIVKSTSPAMFDVYNVSPGVGQTGWAGTISLNGGLSSNKMYKTKFAIAQQILATGLPLNISTQIFPLDTVWTGLPYIPNRNLPINEALANLDPQSGDIIKSQSQFAIYDRVSRSWKGNLTTMYVGEGYMIKVARRQNFSYPVYANNSQSSSGNITNSSLNDIISMTINSGQMSSGLSNVFTQSNSINNTQKIKLNSELTSYGETMNIIAQIPKEYDSVVFYNEETNQIVGQTQNVNFNNDRFVFATLYADSTINIKADLINSKSKANAVGTIQFATNSLLGSLQNPYQINIAKKANYELTAYPNPFASVLNIEFVSDVKGVANLYIYNDQSRLLEVKQINVTKGHNSYTYHASSAIKGNYFVFKVDVGDRIYTKVVIKF